MERELVLIVLFISFVYITACPPCETLQCPKSVAECPLGAVPDPCSCCTLGRCGLSRGQLCFNQTYSHPDHMKYGTCATTSYCMIVESEEMPDVEQGICVCNEHQVACGSNNHTYEDICSLNEAATESGSLRNLTVQYWGPCFMVPEIVTSPQDVATILGQPVSLDCEVKGYPAPVITWEFTGNDGLIKLLPSDDSLISIQVRGGPESQMSTSWVQLAELRPTDAGLYSCVATNDKGTARAMARVDISGMS